MEPEPARPDPIKACELKEQLRALSEAADFVARQLPRKPPPAVRVAELYSQAREVRLALLRASAALARPV